MTQALASFVQAWNRHDAEALTAWSAPQGVAEAEALLLRLGWAKLAGAMLAITNAETFHVEDATALVRTLTREDGSAFIRIYLMVEREGRWRVVAALQ